MLPQAQSGVVTAVTAVQKAVHTVILYRYTCISGLVCLLNAASAASRWRPPHAAYQTYQRRRCPTAAQEENWYQFLLGEDCYSGNCEDGLEWGDPNSTNDNPQIVFNDAFANGETGLGPEVIFIPQPQAQIYTVVVHDVQTELGEGENNFTVQVYLDGELTLRTDQVAPAEGHYLRVAEIDTTNWTATTIFNA